jgi:transcriptional regulator with XRE-family HTH domain
MTGAELRAIRDGLGLSASQMARALGYSGAGRNVAVHIRRLERGARRIPPSVEKLALMYARHGIPKGWYLEIY